MASALLDYLRNADDDTERDKLLYKLATDGYATMNRLIEELKQEIKLFSDEHAEDIQRMLQQAKRTIPHPGRISPAWQTIWEELETMVSAKIRVLQSIPEHEREGEWQVLIDNPYVHQDVVCYPGLSFLEAAYLFGYFRNDLKRNEYVKIQKIQTMMYEFGQ